MHRLKEGGRLAQYRPLKHEEKSIEPQMDADEEGLL
jgi:hypothetical protein